MPDIVRLLGIAGWGLLWLVPLRLFPLWLDALGWRRLLLEVPAPGPVYLTWAAVVREAVATLLPVARVGGEVVGVRLLVRRGVPAAIAGASVVVELTVTIAMQLLFATVGLVLVLGSAPVSSVPRLVAIGLWASLPLFLAFFWLQRRWGIFQLLESVLAAIAGRGVLQTVGDPARLDQAIRVLYRERRAAIACAVWQLAGMFAGALELWVVLRLLGRPTGIGAMIAVESLTLAAQSAMFIVPAGLGAQEGGFVLFGAAVGLSPSVALALSLARRARQLLLGIPALISWYGIEHRGSRAAPSAPRMTPESRPTD
jgi:putative membrane protein